MERRNFTFSTLWNKYWFFSAGLIFTPEVFYVKKCWGEGAGSREFLYAGEMNKLNPVYNMVQSIFKDWPLNNVMATH